MLSNCLLIMNLAFESWRYSVFSELRLQKVHGGCAVEEPKQEHKSLDNEYNTESENHWIMNVEKILEIV